MEVTQLVPVGDGRLTFDGQFNNAAGQHCQSVSYLHVARGGSDGDSVGDCQGAYDAFTAQLDGPNPTNEHAGHMGAGFADCECTNGRPLCASLLC